MDLIPHLLRKLCEHAYRFAGLAELLVPSAAVDDEQVEAWSRELYQRDLDNEPQRTGE